ncbi:glycosyltransferase family 4 protein [Streptomyces misionensis]
MSPRRPAAKSGSRATASLRVVARLHGYPPGHNAGAEWMAHGMLRSLAARGHDVSVWLSRYGAEREVYDLDGVRVVPLQAREDWGAALRAAHVVVSHLENVPAAAAMARGYSRPFVAICHNGHRQTFRDAMAGETALAVYNSQWMRREAELVLAEYPQSLRPARELVVRPPVVAEEYRTQPGDRTTLINCSAEKGGLVLQKLARRLPDTQFLAVQGAHGDQVDLGGLDNVEVLPCRPGGAGMREVYGRTRVLLMPSSYESWGRVGVEAMASGIPVVAHPTPGLAESLGGAGLFAERWDLEAWVAHLQRLSDAEEWALASKRALARSAELDPTDDLVAWCEAVEALA